MGAPLENVVEKLVEVIHRTCWPSAASVNATMRKPDVCVGQPDVVQQWRRGGAAPIGAHHCSHIVRICPAAPLPRNPKCVDSTGGGSSRTPVNRLVNLQFCLVPNPRFEASV